MKRIAIQYGLMIAAAAMAWVLIAHAIYPPQSEVHKLGSTVFDNIVHFLGLFLGIRAFRRLENGRVSFKQSIKMGVAISLVYGLTESLFFGVLMLIVGTEWLSGEPLAFGVSLRVVMLMAFAGLIIGSLLMGLLYSTVIAFSVAKREPTST